MSTASLPERFDVATDDPDDPSEWTIYPMDVPDERVAVEWVTSDVVLDLGAMV